MRDRIRPPKDLEGVLDTLKDAGVFETKQKGMMFAAALGFATSGAGRQGASLDNFGEGIRLDYFVRPRDDGYIDALAVCVAQELTVLAEGRQEERIELFERLAHVGLRKLEEHCTAPGKDPLQGVLDLIDEVELASSDDQLPGLGDAVNRAGELL